MIQPYSANPFYWSIDGEPVLLLGGSVEDNVFQIPDLTEHVETLVAAGGNYLRCTMSCRDQGDIWPFAQKADGRYDLNEWSEEFWEKIRLAAELSRRHKLVLQVEVWDRFDFAREPWQDNPFNPKNNINYTSEESGLREEYLRHPGDRENGFFRSVPALENNSVIRPYQEAFVRRLIDETLGHGYFLYCIDNETNEDPAWPQYRAEMIHQLAAQKGGSVNVTEMWNNHDLDHPEHENTWKNPELYSFCDISQNNHQSHFIHYQNAMAFRARIIETGRIRPINSVKVYGSNDGHYGTDRDALERFWRNIFAGLASTRFHRPDTGLGLSELAQRHISAARQFFEEFTPWQSEPVSSRAPIGHLREGALQQSSANEAYLLSHQDRDEHAVFFPDGGNVILPLRTRGTYRVRWMEIDMAKWGSAMVHSAEDGSLRLTTPERRGYWAAVITPKE